jgi:6-pyruvoyltetrahydropterin/6-carboxytetrahydropterin synthase
VFRLTVEAEFAAAHAIVMRGEREPIHGHNWKVTICVAGESLDEDGLLCDFHAIETSLRAATERFHNKNLNEVSPFDRENPTAELVARHLAEAVSGSVPPQDASRGVRVEWVRVTEAPGCAATYHAPTSDHGR